MRSPRFAWWKKAVLWLGIGVVALLALIGLPLLLVLIGDQIGQGTAVGDRAMRVTALATVSLCGIASLAAIAAAVAAFSSRTTGRRSQNVAEMDLLLRLDERFRYSEFADVSHNLQEGGRWVIPTTEGIEPGPENDEDWLRVTAYVRLFEPIYFVARDGGVPADVLRSTFGYRIDQIVRNRKIVGRMITKSADTPWVHFLKLWQIVDSQGYAHWTHFLQLWQVVDAEGYNRLMQVSSARPMPLWQR